MSEESSPLSQDKFFQVGKYIIHQSSQTCESCTAIDQRTGDEYLCKIVPLSKYRRSLAAYLATDGHPHVVSVWEVVLGEATAYIFFQKGFGDLHSYVREKKRLRQPEARSLARQVVEAVRHCHDSGLVLRDLKLRKFVFKDADRTELRLDGLDDAVVLSDTDASDLLTDKHGCPAYVSPEILSARRGYSGRGADLWSLGVMIYTMLVGRYPFHDREPVVLFDKICRGVYKIPDAVPAPAKCLIRNLLRKDPLERLNAEEALEHPWFTRHEMAEPQARAPPASKGHDQMVPDAGHMGYGLGLPH